MEKRENHEPTPPCRGRSFGRSLSVVTDLAPPSCQPCSFYAPNHSQDYFNIYPLSAPPLAHHNQINPPFALPLTQHHPLAIPQPQPYQTHILNPEQHYLLLSLGRENVKALSLRQKIAAAEASLSSLEVNCPATPALETPISATLATKIASPIPTRRKLKKQLSWLKCRVKECTRQEGILLERLRQIGEEDGRRWQWVQIERQRRINEEMMEWQRQQRRWWEYCGGGGGGGGYGQGNEYANANANGNGNGALDANTPAFQPMSAGGQRSARSSIVRKDSKDFWNTEAPIFSPVNFLATSSKSSSARSSRNGNGQAFGQGLERERLSRGWDECELSPLAEERIEGVGEWDGPAEAETETETETETEIVTGEEEEGSASGSGDGEEEGNSSTETTITTPTPQQSARLTPMGGAKSCNAIQLCFLDTKWGESEVGSGDSEDDCLGRENGGGNCRGLGFWKDRGLRVRCGKSNSLPGVGSGRWFEGKGGKGKGKGKSGEKEKEWFKERKEVDQVW